MKTLEVGYPSDMSRRCIETVQFPKSAKPDLINQSDHQVSQNSFYFVGFFIWVVFFFFGFLNCSMPYLIWKEYYGAKAAINIETKV